MHFDFDTKKYSQRARRMFRIFPKSDPKLFALIGFELVSNEPIYQVTLT
jgi:hypothetical protein